MYMYSIVFVAASTDSTNNKRDNEDYAELHDTRLNWQTVCFCSLQILTAKSVSDKFWLLFKFHFYT